MKQQEERKYKVENNPTETIRQEQEKNGPELRKSVREYKALATYGDLIVQVNYCNVNFNINNI